MRSLNRSTAGSGEPHPVKVLQFGAGNFLRAFVDWMVEILNDRAGFDGSVVVAKPTARGDYQSLREQEYLYHVYLNGFKNGELVETNQLVSCISGVVNPYNEWDSFIDLAKNPSIRFVISNTTEAGIVFSEADRLDDQPAKEFPAKLTQWLFARFRHFEGTHPSGCILLPCELIEQNGEALRSSVLKYSKLWGLGEEFERWITKSNHFCNTLVDRIVSGYPTNLAAEIEKTIGFTDKLLVTGEQYHSWIIDAPPIVQAELPFSKTELNVSFVDDLQPYRDMKVRILNGAHTAMVPIGSLLGLATVDQVMDDPQAASFVKELLAQEVLPTLDFSAKSRESYMNATLSRFKNPYLKHQLKSIALNSVSKFRARLVPTIEAYCLDGSEVPKRILFSLAGLITMYKGSYQGIEFELNDDAQVLSVFEQFWNEIDSNDRSLIDGVRILMSHSRLWGKDLTLFAGLVETTTRYLHDIRTNGMRKALKAI